MHQIGQGIGWWDRLEVPTVIRAPHRRRWCFPRGKQGVRTGATAGWLLSAHRPSRGHPHTDPLAVPRLTPSRRPGRTWWSAGLGRACRERAGWDGMGRAGWDHPISTSSSQGPEAAQRCCGAKLSISMDHCPLPPSSQLRHMICSLTDSTPAYLICSPSPSMHTAPPGPSCM